MQKIITLTIKHNKRILTHQFLHIMPTTNRMQHIPPNYKIKSSPLIFLLQIIQQIVCIHLPTHPHTHLHLLIRHLYQFRFSIQPINHLKTSLHRQQQPLILPISTRQQPYLINSLSFGQYLYQLHMSLMQRIKRASIYGYIFHINI